MACVTPDFFECDALTLAQRMLGKVLRRHWQGHWLAARIIETEAYTLHDRGSHASLGYTHARRALFMGGGTIYMYYARGGDSLNIGAPGEGNAVLIKSAYPSSTEQIVCRADPVMSRTCAESPRLECAYLRPAGVLS